MIVEIDGYLIDLKKIYKISPVESYFSHRDMRDKTLVSYYDMNFDILFVNKKTHRVSGGFDILIPMEKIDPSFNDFYSDAFEVDVLSGIVYTDKIAKFNSKRGELITLWGENQGDIKKFNFSDL